MIRVVKKISKLKGFCFLCVHFGQKKFTKKIMTVEYYLKLSVIKNIRISFHNS